MDKVDLIFDRVCILNKQLAAAKDNQLTPPKVKGILEAMEISMKEVARMALDLHDFANKMRDDHEREIKRLKSRIAKLETQKQQ